MPDFTPQELEQAEKYRELLIRAEKIREEITMNMAEITFIRTYTGDPYFQWRKEKPISKNPIEQEIIDLTDFILLMNDFEEKPVTYVEALIQAKNQLALKKDIEYAALQLRFNQAQADIMKFQYRNLGGEPLND